MAHRHLWAWGPLANNGPSTRGAGGAPRPNGPAVSAYASGSRMALDQERASLAWSGRPVRNPWNVMRLSWLLVWDPQRSETCDVGATPADGLPGRPADFPAKPCSPLESTPYPNPVTPVGERT